MIRSVCIVVLSLFAVGYAEPSTNDGHVWVAGNLSIPFPSNAVQAGWVQDGTKIYVGRVNATEKGFLPARIIAENGTALYGYVLNNAYAFGYKLSYDILVDEGDFEYAWIRSYDGFYEEGSVTVGTLRNSDQSFICRAWLNGELLIGNKYGSEKTCYIYSNAGYIHVDVGKYEMLVGRANGC